jgi:hypothetical protein
MQKNDNSQPASADDLIQQKQAAAQKQFKRISIAAATIVAIAVSAYFVNEMIAQPTDMSMEQVADVTEKSVKTSAQQAQISEASRQQFIESYGEFEQRHKSLLTNPLIKRFDEDSTESLLALEQQALASFAKSAFQTAADEVEQLIEGTIQLKVAWQKAHAQAISQANDYYFKGDINRATLAYQNAVKINPDHDENALVKQRIDSFEAINRLKQTLSVAQVENNLERQQQTLAELMTLPDQMAVYQSEYDRVSAELDERALSALLLQADSALDAEDPVSATKLIGQAKRINANAAAIGLLEKKLNSIRKQQTKQAWFAQLDKHVAADNWQQVIVDAQTASTQFIDEPKFKALKQTAEQILSTQRRINLFLRQPERLKDNGLREQAKITLRTALPLSLQSQTLAQDVKRLANHIDAYQQSMPVVIESDGESDIQVVGVGQVGTTLSKQIELTPGTYTVEARRTGYKTVRKTFTVSGEEPKTIFIATEDKI